VRKIAYLIVCKMTCQVLSEHVFDGGKVNIHICNNGLNTLRVISPD